MKQFLIAIFLATFSFSAPFEGVAVPDARQELRQFIYTAKVASVYDADTATLDIDLGMKVWKHGEQIRFYGINAPEISGVERPLGLAAKAFLVELLAKPRKGTFIMTIKDRREKYGRWLGILLLEAEDGTLLNVNQELVRAGHAVIEKY